MATATRKPKLTNLLERVFSESLNVDAGNGVIAGVKILGRDSRNGRTYTDAALQEAAEKYEGIKVNVNHPPRDNPDAERDYGDGIGELRNVQVREGAVFGDLHYNRKHPLAEKLVEDAQRFPRSLGLSHNADGQTAKRGGKVFVESVVNVRSVDIVGRPASTNGLYESEQPPMKRKTTIKQILDAVDATSPGYDRLREMIEGDPAMGDMPIDMPMEAAPDDSGKEKPEAMIQEGIKAAVLAKLEKATPEQWAAVLAALEMGDSLSAAATGKSEPGDADPPAEPTTESEQMKALAEKVRLLEARAKVAEAESLAAKAESSVRALLESLDREATPVRVKALVAMQNEADRKALVNEWPKRVQQIGRPPVRTQPLTESELPGEYKPLPAEEWARTIRG